MTKNSSGLKQPVGFIGLGAMGTPIATNMGKAGFMLRVFDKAGTAERADPDTEIGESISDLAKRCETICLCVPDGAAAAEIAEDIINTDDRVTKVVIDHSTTGVEHAEANAARLAEAGITYIDCPVSGGRTGAIAGTITMIWGGPGDVLEQHRSLIEAASGNIFHVGDKAGQGQTVKLLNNFLSGTAMVATAEAVAYGVSRGVDMKTILDVVNVSTGMNTATKDKFPNRILTETFDAGFRSDLMRKDLTLYLQSVTESGTAASVGKVVKNMWSEVDEARPQSDITQVYKHLTEGD